MEHDRQRELRKLRLKYPQRYARQQLRSKLYLAFRTNNATGSIKKLIGCTIPQLKKRLEAQFSPGMTWDNYGHQGWHIDHIRPCASFDLTKARQQKKCFHYTNLQPLWGRTNMKKSGKWNGKNWR